MGVFAGIFRLVGVGALWLSQLYVASNLFYTIFFAAVKKPLKNLRGRPGFEARLYVHAPVMC